MRFLIEAVYCMTWIWTLHRAHNQWKSPIEEDNVWAISAMLKVPDGTFSWKWFKSLAQRSDLNLVGSTWSPK